MKRGHNRKVIEKDWKYLKCGVAGKWKVSVGQKKKKKACIISDMIR